MLDNFDVVECSGTFFHMWGSICKFIPSCGYCPMTGPLYIDIAIWLVLCILMRSEWWMCNDIDY